MSYQFFFIIRSFKTKALERVLISAELCNPNLLKINENIFTNNTLVNSVKELYLNYLVSKTNDEIKSRYIDKVNQLNLFFKDQLRNITQIKSDRYTNYQDKEFDEIIKSVSVLFLESQYKSNNLNELDKYKVIITPNVFITLIDKNIELAVKINKSILEKYNFLVYKDKELLKTKNEILLSKNIFNFEEIITTLKEREMISYILIDIDADITNALIKFNDLKFRKLFSDECDLVETFKNFKELIDNLKKNATICKNNYNLLDS
jgi:hypothetical protein